LRLLMLLPDHFLALLEGLTSLSGGLMPRRL
jgi:hypothetical protein